MKRALLVSVGLILAFTVGLGDAHAQYAVGHRTWGVGTAIGAGFQKMDLQFARINDGVISEDMTLLLPTLEMKYFLSDQLSIDLSMPIVNVALSNALRDYFFVTGEAFINFHASAPSSMELFVAPGIGFSYASDSYEEQGVEYNESAWAFHVPVRIGVEFNNATRKFGWMIAVRPFFNLVHGNKGDITPGGGVMVELAFHAYGVSYRADRY
ncbi:MAG: hypothetical protein KAI47_21970 [Deltaproteobacteria bacterium]|nr:hypothetical protein [Deltaproteobacteria bacterium]